MIHGSLQIEGNGGDYMLHPEVLKILNLHGSFLC